MTIPQAIALLIAGCTISLCCVIIAASLCCQPLQDPADDQGEGQSGVGSHGERR